MARVNCKLNANAAIVATTIAELEKVSAKGQSIRCATPLYANAAIAVKS